MTSKLREKGVEELLANTDVIVSPAISKVLTQMLNVVAVGLS